MALVASVPAIIPRLTNSSVIRPGCYGKLGSRLAHDHELMVLYHPVGEEVELSTKMDGLRSLIASQGNDVADVFHWGRRRLAYPIKRQFEADYVIAEFSGVGDHAEIERSLNIDESVLRHLLIRRDSDGVAASDDA